MNRPHRTVATILGTASMLAVAANFATPVYAQAQPDRQSPADAASAPPSGTTTRPAGKAAEPVSSSAVTQSSVTDADIVVTGRFVDPSATSATKLNIRVLDTPFSVDSYNGNFLKGRSKQPTSPTCTSI